MFRYEEIAQELQRRIASGTYDTGRLPAERVLSQEFGVQRDTIRRALEVMTEAGVLVRHSTRGTYIPARPEPVELTPASTGGVLLVVRTFEDTTAPSAVFRGLSQRLSEESLPAYWFDPGVKGSDIEEDKPQRRLPSRTLLETRGVAGVVLWPQLPTAPVELRELRSLVPLVLIDRKVPGFEADFVGFEDFIGGQTVTDHLLRCGYQRIGFVSGEPQATAVQSRLSGYRAALEAAGVPFHPSRVLLQEGGSRLLAPAAVRTFLSGDDQPLTAVVCANDIVAARMIHFIRGLGKRVPEDVAVTGFGDLMPSVMDAFGITTVAQPFEEMGRAAGELLLRQLRGDRATEPREIDLPMRLIVRESCGSLLGAGVATG